MKPICNSWSRLRKSFPGLVEQESSPAVGEGVDWRAEVELSDYWIKRMIQNIRL